MDTKQMVNKLTHKFVMLAELGLFIRFWFSLLDADKTNTFVMWIYNMTDTLLTPIRGVFPAESFQNRFVFEFRVVFAMVVYAIFGYLIMVMLHVLPKPRLTKMKWDKIGKWQRVK